MIPNEDLALSFPIKDQADLTLALIKTGESGLLAEASPLDQSLIKTIISELGTNIIKYATRGKIHLRRIRSDDAIDINIEAHDQGPGIVNVELAMKDRFTTGTSLGLGLPSVKRMSDTFSIESEPGQGTRVLAQKRIQGRPYLQNDKSRPPPRPPGRRTENPPKMTLQTRQLEIACYSRPVPGELVSGDMAELFELRDGVLLVLMDVSGHGHKAHALADEISRFLTLNAESNIKLLMSRLHTKLHGTQGAAVALLYIDIEKATGQFCAVGNTRAYRVVGDAWRPISKDGVLGQRLPTIPEQSVRFNNGDVIMLWTDGVSDTAGRSFAAQHSYRSADMLARDVVTELGRPYDDASCIIFKWIA
jgi:anti-sigma regulatory factor (Ser/Thr protein kinase)